MYFYFRLLIEFVSQDTVKGREGKVQILGLFECDLIFFNTYSRILWSSGAC